MKFKQAPNETLTVVFAAKPAKPDNKDSVEQPQQSIILSQAQAAQFEQSLLAWFDQFGRHDLPWQQDINPYRVWVSEIMLQQTQVVTVIPYFERFMQSFPDIKALARASQEQVLAHWAGLGYYARGRNLHKAAQIIMEKYQGEFPEQFDLIVELPGIGRSTAGAILSIALAKRYAILDGNVKRVLGRYFAIERWLGEAAVEKPLWALADALTPQQRFADYTQAIMDLGATLCKRSKPQCGICPIKQGCQALAQQRVADFPYKKAQKPKPTKQAWLLLMENSEQQLLLHNRPAKGIWGGLWSLPQFDDEQAMRRFIESHSISSHSLVKWPELKHTFSHYHLQIKPCYLVAEQTPKNLVAEPTTDYQVKYQMAEIAQQQWFDTMKIGSTELAFPAPIQTLLRKWCGIIHK